jgi:large subunit ribosomal protein L25
VIRNEAASPGLKRGGVLNLVRHEIEFVCSPEAIPQAIEVDVTGLEIGGSIHISAVTLPENARLVVRERDFTVVSIGAPTGLKAEQQEAAEKAAAAAAGATAAAAAPGAAPAAGAPAAGAAAPAGAAPGAAAGGAAAAKAPEKKK